MGNGHIWRAAQERLRREMTPAQFDTWLRGTSLAADDDGTSVLCVRSTFAKELLESRYRERIQAAIGEVTGQQCALRIAVAPTAEDAALDSDSSPRQATSTARASVATRSPTRSARPHPMADGYVRPSLFALPAEPAPQATPPAGTQPPKSVPAPRWPSRSTLTLGRRRGASRGASPAAIKTERVRAAIERTKAQHATSARFSTRPMALAGDQPQRRAAHARMTGPAARVTTRHSAPLGDVTGDGTMASGGHDNAHPARAPQADTTGTERHPLLSGGDGAAGVASSAVAGAASGPTAIASPRLNARYTFATFIVGSGNQLAHAASLAVADAPGQAYNPLFLYGGVGLGKTHLLHAIGHTAIERGLAVLYVSSETFTNEIINAIRFRTTEEFRAKYRSVDVLLVDDIQFIAGKDSTEEEFFHTFNSLYEMSKQIVICSDRPPKAIVSLEERLRSRFEWGLIADIQPPDLETRVAILRAKADLLQRQVPDEVLTYLAGAVQSNIRELEGSLNRLLAIAQLQGKPLTIETAKSAISNLASDGKQKRVGIQEVLAAVAEHYRIPVADLQGKQRDKHIVVPRQVAMYLMRQETEASLLEIGQALGGRDHSTVLHGCEKISREINENTALRKEVLAIRQQLFG
ncbi:MAG TPA: chromosomal replication initiator protein DnaA [Ktedonobacterales bacterium]